MPYKDTLYWVNFVSKKSGHMITHAGMTWDSYHRLIGQLVVEGVTFTTGEESVIPNVWKTMSGEMGQAGGR